MSLYLEAWTEKLEATAKTLIPLFSLDGDYDECQEIASKQVFIEMCKWGKENGVTDPLTRLEKLFEMGANHSFGDDIPEGVDDSMGNFILCCSDCDEYEITINTVTPTKVSVSVAYVLD